MTPAHRPSAKTGPAPFGGEYAPGPHIEAASDPSWAAALRALLVVTESAHPGDPLLARLSDEELAQLRASLVLLGEIEPTSAA